MANKKTAVTHNTTKLVSDRLAKLVATYTNGYARVHYVADRVCTDVKGNIYLPAYLRDMKPELEANAFAYTLHESGHQGVENDLKIDRKRRKKTNCSKELFAMVPTELRSIACEPGTKILLTSEFLKNVESYGLTIASAYEGSAYAAASQLRTLVNVFEDPRMENQVGRRWKGAVSYLAHGNEIAHKQWREKATELIASGKDRTFDVFSIGLLFAIADQDYAFLGPVVQAQVEACSDIIELFKNVANWETSHGFYDSVNAALTCLSRIYRREEPVETPAPACPSCGSENLKGTFRRPNKLTTICLDCGHREEQDVEMDADGIGGETGPSMDVEMESDMFDSPDGEDGESGEGGEGEGSEGDEKGDSSPEGGEGGEGAGQGEGDDDGGEDGGDTSPKGLEPGMVIRVKSDGTRAKIIAINSDGSIEAEIMEAS